MFCPPGTRESKMRVLKIFKEEASRYESYSLLFLDELCAFEIFDISRKDIETERKQK